MLKTSAEANGFSLEFKIKPNYLKQAIVIVFGSKMKKGVYKSAHKRTKIKKAIEKFDSSSSFAKDCN